jgi:hypothetical protein
MGRDPVHGEHNDVERFEIMRGANLYIFWDWASVTVGSNLWTGMQSKKTTGCLTMPMGPFPLKDSLR